MLGFDVHPGSGPHFNGCYEWIGDAGHSILLASPHCAPGVQTNYNMSCACLSSNVLTHSVRLSKGEAAHSRCTARLSVVGSLWRYGALLGPWLV